MKKQILRQLPPCPDYSMAKLEQWLEDMEAQGWAADAHNSVFGYFRFQKVTPKRVHYRLEVTPKARTSWEAGPPDSEELELHRELGWDYVLHFREFFLYRSTQDHPREPHTDVQIQAMTLKVLTRKLLGNLASGLFTLALQFSLSVFSYPLMLASQFGSLLCVLFYLWMISLVIQPFRSVVQIAILRRRILRGQQPSGEYHRGAGPARVLRVGQWVLTAVTVVGLLTIVISAGDTGATETWQEPVPFVTMEDWLPGKAETTGTLTYHTDPLFPRSYTWNENSAEGGLQILYTETVCPWLAQATARQLTRFSSRRDLGWSKKIITPLPELGLDYAMVLSNQFGNLRVVLAHGNVAVDCFCTVRNEADEFGVVEWAEQMAARLINP